MKTRGIPAAALGLACLSLSLFAPSPASAGDAGRPPLGPIPPDLGKRLGHLTLDDAIDIALHRSPTILNQLQEIQRTQGVVIQMRGVALPQVIATGSFQQTDKGLLENGNSTSGGTNNSTLQDVYLRTVTAPTAIDPTGANSTKVGAISGSQLVSQVLSGGSATGATGTTTGTTGATSLSSLLGGTSAESDKNYMVQIEVQQTLYNAAIPPSIRQAKFLRDSAYYTLRETMDTVINTVKTGFYSILFDEGNIANQNENLRLLQSQLTDQQNRFAAGTVPRFNVLQASVAVANQRPNVITANNQVNLDNISFLRALGLEYGPEESMRAPLKLAGNLDYHPQDFDPVAGENAGKANRGLLKSQRLVILSNVEQVRVAAAGYQPVLIGQGGYEIRNDELTDNLGQSLHGWFYGANFNWNIFDGLQTYGRVKQAQAVLREARNTYLDDVNQVVQDIQNNFLQIQQTKELIASQVLNVSEAEEAVRLAQARLSAGAGTQLDVLTSQQQLLAAQTTLLQARFNYSVALANYERVTGTSTIYDEAFYDPLTNRRQPFGHDTSGTPPTGKPMPLGTVKTPDTVERGTGKPIKARINAEAPQRAARPAKPLLKRDYILEE